MYRGGKGGSGTLSADHSSVHHTGDDRHRAHGPVGHAVQGSKGGKVRWVN